MATKACGTVAAMAAVYFLSYAAERAVGYVKNAQIRHHAESRSQAEAVWVALKNRGKLAWCSSISANDFHQLDSVIDLNNRPATALSTFRLKPGSSPDLYSLSQEIRRKILTVVVSCYAEGWAVINDATNVYLVAEIFLQDDHDVRGTLYPRIVPSPVRLEDETPLECLRLSQEGSFGVFYFNTLMREEDDGKRIYVNESWRKIPFYQKEKIIEFAGRCRKVGYAYIYDGYSGKQLGRYLPMLGASVETD